MKSGKWFYEDSLPSPLSLDAEMTLWQGKWERQDPNTVPTTGDLKGERPCTVSQHRQVPQNICHLTSHHECERNVSALRRLITYLRSTMSRTRLTGLALLHIHHNMEIDLDKIIQSADLQGFIREEWNWPISCLNDSGTQERGLRELKSERIARGSMRPKDPRLEACAFGARLGNR